MERRKTRRVPIGRAAIGGTSPVLVQSMTNTDTADAEATLEQIARLEAAGCEAVRCAFYGSGCAAPFKRIKNAAKIPVIADVHFDAELAVLAIESGADKVRINPGNIGGEREIERIVRCAKANGAAIRIGVNSGSLERDLFKKYAGATAEALAQSAIRSLRFVYELGFFDVVVSIKASSVPVCVEANRIFSKQCDAPLHIGITEAGTYENALIKSAAGIGALLLDGIGDTVRVSVTGDPVREIAAAKRILQAAGARRFFPEVISCPTCARTKIDVCMLAEKVESILAETGKAVTAAVMGCAVNGPGEARHADIGIAGGAGKAVLFANGEPLGSYPEGEILSVFKKYVEQNF